MLKAISNSRLAAALVLALCAGLPAFPQAGTGTVRGSVVDSTQAAIPEATVRIIHRDTNISRQTVSSSEGIYSVTALPPGRYSVTVEAPGFKKFAGTLDLQAGQTAVVEAVMEVGNVDTVIEVSGAAPVITTESTEVGDVKDSLRIRQLPLNGRDISSLFSLTPGVEAGGNGANPRVNGMKVGSTEMLLDGISLVDRFGGGMARVQPGLDTVDEFRIETSGSPAQYSRPATVTLVTKSGTNQFHGSLFETHRNNAAGLRARQRQDGLTSPKLIRNEFGASAGGPVIVPRLYNGKDRTFWFFAYEGLRQAEERFERGTVPTAQMWDRNFNGIFDSAGRQTNIYDPLTTDAQGRRQPFAGNIIPQNRVNPFFDKMRAVTPLPVNEVNPYIGPNFQAVYPNSTRVYRVTAKGDHRFSDKDSITGRISISDRANKLFGGRFGTPPAGMDNGYGSGRQDTKVYSTSIRHTHMFSPTVLNELTLGNHRSANSGGTLADFTPWANDLGLPNPFGASGWPTMYTEVFAWDADNRKDENLTGYIVEDNISWVSGRHSFKAGGKLRWEQNNVRELQQAQGSHGFESQWTSLYDPAADQAVSFTGDGMAAMALGLPSQLTNQNNRGYFYFRQKELGLYFQDTWRVSSRLTLDVGVRWDRWSPYSEKQNRFVQIDPLTLSSAFQVVTPGSVAMEQIPGVLPSQLASWAARGLTWTTADQAGMPSNLVRADNNNLAPRIGVAYKLSDRSVLRASYGEYFWTMPLSQILQSMRTSPPLNLRYTNDIATLDGTSTFGVRTTPRPEFFVGRATVDTAGLVRIAPAAQAGMLMDGRNWKDGRARKWHFTYERQLMRETSLRLSYLGEQGRDLEQRYSINQREAEYNYVARTGANPPGNRDLMRVNKDWNLLSANRTGYSNTHALQGEFERRFSNGFLIQTFYTFSRSMNTTDSDGFTSGNGNINAVGTATAQVPENGQILGNPNLSYDDRLKLAYYNSGFVPAHRIRWNGVYELPFGRGKAFGRDAGGLLNHLIGGWQIGALGDWRSGLWMGVNSGRYLFGDPTLSGDERLELTFNGRPQRLWFRGDFDVTRATNVDSSRLQALIPLDRGQRVLRPVGANFDNRVPVTLSNGTSRLTPITDTINWNARNFFRGPGSWTSDMSVAKFFTIREGATLRFSADFFNAFNHPVDGLPDTTTGLQDLSVQTNDPRIVQFSLRLSW